MLIALPWEHEGPIIDTFTRRRRSKLPCDITECPTPCSLTVVPAPAIQVSTRTGRGKCRSPPGAANWLSGLNKAPHAQASVPASGAPWISHPSTEKPILEPAREVGGGSSWDCSVCYSNCERMIWVRGRHNCYSPRLKSVFFQWPSYCLSQSFFWKMTFLG